MTPAEEIAALNAKHAKELAAKDAEIAAKNAAIDAATRARLAADCRTLAAQRQATAADTKAAQARGWMLLLGIGATVACVSSARAAQK